MPSSKCVIKWGRLFKWAKLTESNVQCRYCKCFSRSVEGLRTTQLKQHERGVLHRFRRATALGCSPNLPGTPSMDTFLGVVERRLKGESLRKSPLGRYKEKNISWCLNEAMLDMERKKLGKCQVALISQDAQGPMLSVRFACVSNRAVKPQRGQLELHQGLLGLFHGQICGARRIARTTLRVAKTMFQARRKPPSGWCGKAPTFYKKAWQHFRRRVEPRRQSFACSMFQNKMLLPDADAAEEMFASDAAADELRAGRLLSLRDHFPAETFPAMKIRLRDSAHAVQRQLSAVLTCCIPSKQPCAERTTNRQLPCWLRFAKKWHLDETLQEYMQQFISGKESMTALIWHSPDLKVMFAKHVARLKSGHVLTHMPQVWP